MAEITGVVDSAEAVRLDKYISEQCGLLTRSQLKTRLVRARVNGTEVKLSRLVKPGDRYELALTDEPDQSEHAEHIPLSIVFQNDRVVVVDKAQGMVSHPAHGNWNGTLANALLGLAETRAAGAGASAVKPPMRAGIVHRLDKDTSGVIIAARDADAQEFLSAQFRSRRTEKTYWAIVMGKPRTDSGTVDTWLARDSRDRKRFAVSADGVGKRALSGYKLVWSAGGYSLLSLRLFTGRTHQLRVHCKHLGCPILGDPLYGKLDKRFPDATLMLHAMELKICLPEETQMRAFHAPLPERFVQVLEALDMDRTRLSLYVHSLNI